MPDRMPEDMSDRVSEDMPDRMPEDLPDKMPEDMPDHMPEDMPDRMSNRMSEDMSDRMPEDMPDHMPEDMPDRMSNRMSEDMSDRMSEDLPVRKCINVMVGITRSKVIFFFILCIYQTKASTLAWNDRYTTGTWENLLRCVHTKFANIAKQRQPKHRELQAIWSKKETCAQSLWWDNVW